MRTMKEMKHQTQQLLVAMETWAPTTAAGRTPSQLQMPLGPLSCCGAGVLGTAQSQRSPSGLAGLLRLVPRTLQGSTWGLLFSSCPPSSSAKLQPLHPHPN